MVEKSGAWFSINGERMGQGRDAAKTFLKENPQYKTELRTKILASHGIGKLLLDTDTSDNAEHAKEEAPVEAEESAPKKAKKAKH